MPQMFVAWAMGGLWLQSWYRDDYAGWNLGGKLNSDLDMLSLKCLVDIKRVQPIWQLYKDEFSGENGEWN